MSVCTVCRDAQALCTHGLSHPPGSMACSDVDQLDARLPSTTYGYCATPHVQCVGSSLVVVGRGRGFAVRCLLFVGYTRSHVRTLDHDAPFLREPSVLWVSIHMCECDL